LSAIEHCFKAEQFFLKEMLHCFKAKRFFLSTMKHCLSTIKHCFKAEKFFFKETRHFFKAKKFFLKEMRHFLSTMEHCFKAERFFLSAEKPLFNCQNWYWPANYFSVFAKWLFPTNGASKLPAVQQVNVVIDELRKALFIKQCHKQSTLNLKQYSSLMFIYTTF
jgi:hypothetical protein